MRSAGFLVAFVVLPLAIVPACTCSKTDASAKPADPGAIVDAAPTATTTTTATTPTVATVGGPPPMVTVRPVPSGMLRRIPPGVHIGAGTTPTVMPH